jgi:serine/threonine protein kinase
VSAVKETDEKKSRASDLAVKAAMEGYFSNLDERSLASTKTLFMDNLQRVDMKAEEVICRQNEPGDKLFVLEEGQVDFIVNGKVAGSAKDGAVFGELSLVYGVNRQCDVKCTTKCIIWTLDALAFRRIQAIVAKDNLRTSKSKIMTKFGKEASTLSEVQEVSVKKIKNEIAFNELTLLNVVGQGTFGAVHIVSRKSDPNFSYALKKMSKASIVERENESRVVIERNALMVVKGCPFIISLMGTYQDKDCIYFLTECVQGGNLISYMIDKDILTHSESMFYCYNIAMALIHTHNKGYVHRDIKPENCLIDKNGYVKLCDYGMAKRLPCTVVLPNGGTEVVRLAYTMCGTPEFMAPEFVLSTGYDHGVDFWALGCILVEMYSGRGPFDFDGDLKKTFKAVCLVGMGRKALDLPKQLKKKGMESAGDFARKLLTGNNTRLGTESPNDVIEHPYFNQLDKAEINNLTFQAPYIPKVSGAKDASNFKQDGEAPKEDPIEPYSGANDWCEGF